jgi:hypothetical protein
MIPHKALQIEGGEAYRDLVPAMLVSWKSKGRCVEPRYGDSRKQLPP